MRNREEREKLVQSGAWGGGVGCRRKATQPSEIGTLITGPGCVAIQLSDPSPSRAQAVFGTSPSQDSVPPTCQSQLLLSAGGCGPHSGLSDRQIGKLGLGPRATPLPGSGFPRILGGGGLYLSVWHPAPFSFLPWASRFRPFSMSGTLCYSV